MHSYVVEGPGGRITDLLSFYTLPSSVIGNDQYDSLKVGGRAAVLPWAPTAADWAVEEHGKLLAAVGWLSFSLGDWHPTICLSFPCRPPTCSTQCQVPRRCRSS